MAKMNHVTFGGLGQHEYYTPTTDRGHKNRRDRRRCRHYDSDTKYCDKLQTSCVGPTLCKKYSPRKPFPKENRPYLFLQQLERLFTVNI